MDRLADVERGTFPAHGAPLIPRGDRRRLRANALEVLQENHWKPLESLK